MCSGTENDSPWLVTKDYTILNLLFCTEINYWYCNRQDNWQISHIVTDKTIDTICLRQWTLDTWHYMSIMVDRDRDRDREIER